MLAKNSYILIRINFVSVIQCIQKVSIHTAHSETILGSCNVNLNLKIPNGARAV